MNQIGIEMVYYYFDRFRDENVTNRIIATLKSCGYDIETEDNVYTFIATKHGENTIKMEDPHTLYYCKQVYINSLDQLTSELLRGTGHEGLEFSKDYIDVDEHYDVQPAFNILFHNLDDISGTREIEIIDHLTKIGQEFGKSIYQVEFKIYVNPYTYSMTSEKIYTLMLTPERLILDIPA